MATSTRDSLTTIPTQADFFLSPEKPLHRQYEALRAYFVEDHSSAETAERFGYTTGAFRVLCTRFRQDTEKGDHFFRDPQRGPRAAPVRDRLRERVVGMRKKNLSVYDIQAQLREVGEEVSINALSVELGDRWYVPRCEPGTGQRGFDDVALKTR